MSVERFRVSLMVLLLLPCFITSTNVSEISNSYYYICLDGIIAKTRGKRNEFNIVMDWCAREEYGSMEKGELSPAKTVSAHLVPYNIRNRTRVYFI